MKYMKKATSIVVMLVLVLNLMPVMNGGTSQNTILASDGEDGTYASVLESVSDSKEFTIEIDYSNKNSAAICLVRTGDTDVQMVITDETGNTVTKLAAVETNARRWVFLDAPATDTQTVTYTVTVKVYNERMGKDGSFRLMVGDKKDTERMISGRENAVYLNLYTEEKGNQFFTYYTPDNYMSWYRFTAKEAETVITLLTKNKNIRFSVYGVDNLEEIYHSEKDAKAHKTKWIPSSYVAAEKTSLKTLTIGKDYYLVIYNAKPSGTDVFDTKTMNLTVGKPNMLSNSATVYSTSSITGRKTSYSASATINATSIPRTAVIDRVTFKTSTSGVRFSSIDYWKVKTPEETAWRSSGTQYINVGYRQDASNNVKAYGKWLFSFKTTSSVPSLTLVPGIDISYYYEIGD